MKTYRNIALLAGATLALTGCIDRDEANARLQAGCEAAVRAITNAPFEIKAVKETSFEEVSYGADEGLRQVTMTVTESDGWLSRDKQYKCVFTEWLGFFNMRHTADLYRLEVGNIALGKGEGATADPQRWVPLMNAAKKGMTAQ